MNSVFIVSNPTARTNIKNVILVARDREDAKRLAQPFLFDNPDNYIVDPITNEASATMFLIMGIAGR
jgi:hypothetical protein